MVDTEAMKTVTPNVRRSFPGGGSLFWRSLNRAVLTSVGLLSKGFLRLQRNVRVDGLEQFLNILESKRDRGIITGRSCLNFADD